MSTELAVRQSERPRGTVMTLDEKIRYAEHVAQAGLVPTAYRRQPANVLIALEYAEALGVQPINAMTSIHVIEGKPSASADLMAVMVRRAGHKLRVRGDDTYAEATLIRADDPEFPFEARWDIPKAERANLARKDVWRSYPGAMLKARAISEVCRTGASEALFGVIYTPEELGAEVDGEGNVLRAEATRADQPAGSGADQPASPPPAAPAAPRLADDAPDATGLDCDAWKAKLAELPSLDAARALWRETGKDVLDRDCGGTPLYRLLEARMVELRDAETAAAAEAAGDASADEGDDDVPDDVPEGVGEPLNLGDGTPEAPLEGELLDAPDAAPAEADPEDLRRNTAQRRSTLQELTRLFRGGEAMAAACEQVFGLAPDDVATNRLRKWMGDLQREAAATPTA